MFVSIEENQEKKLKKKITNFLRFFLLFSVLSGAIRKWLLPNNSVGNVILLIQLIIPFYFGVFTFNKKIVSPFKKYKLLIIYLGLLFLLAINPMNLTLFHGLFGIILYLGFWFMILFYTANRQYFETNKLTTLAIILGSIEVVLGFVQYNMPESHFINKYADPSQVQSIATVGQRVRIAGTFSFLGGMSSFLIFYAFLLWVMLRKGYNKQLIIVLLIAGFAISFMTGSRGTVFSFIIILSVMIISEFRNSGALRKLLLQAFLFSVFVASISYFLGDRFGIGKQIEIAWENFDNRVQSNRMNGEENRRVLEPILGVINFHGEYPVVGVGLGASYQGATALFGSSRYVQEFGYYEGEWERIILEGGFVLFIFRIFLFIVLFRALNMPILTKVLLMLFTFFFCAMVFNIYNQVFYFLGLMMLDQSYSFKKNIASERTNLHITEKQPVLS